MSGRSRYTGHDREVMRPLQGKIPRSGAAVEYACYYPILKLNFCSHFLKRNMILTDSKLLASFLSILSVAT